MAPALLTWGVTSASVQAVSSSGWAYPGVTVQTFLADSFCVGQSPNCSS